MTSGEHHARAEELLARARKIYIAAQEFQKAHGGLAPERHAGLFREMAAVTALAQVHATLAAAR